MYWKIVYCLFYNTVNQKKLVLQKRAVIYVVQYLFLQYLVRIFLRIILQQLLFYV